MHSQQDEGANYFPLFGTPEVSSRIENPVLSLPVQDGCQQTGQSPMEGYWDSVGAGTHDIW